MYRLLTVCALSVLAISTAKAKQFNCGQNTLQRNDSTGNAVSKLLLDSAWAL